MKPGCSVAKNKSRLDNLLVEKGMAESREKAKAFIMAGVVAVNGRMVDKPGYGVPENAEITIKNDPMPYVSRGGLKLEAALDHFNMDVHDAVILDIGASTGGFTDCLLKRGAGKVIAVDVGYGQLHWTLRQNSRVIILEKTNARYLTREVIKEPADGAVIDVSFISLKLIIPPVSCLLKENSFIIALIKPQFEAGKDQVGKGGVVRDPELREKIVHDIETFCKECGWSQKGVIPSPILGPRGNQEYLIYIKRQSTPVS